MHLGTSANAARRLPSTLTDIFSCTNAVATLEHAGPAKMEHIPEDHSNDAIKTYDDVINGAGSVSSRDLSGKRRSDTPLLWSSDDELSLIQAHSCDVSRSRAQNAVTGMLGRPLTPMILVSDEEEEGQAHENDAIRSRDMKATQEPVGTPLGPGCDDLNHHSDNVTTAQSRDADRQQQPTATASRQHRPEGADSHELAHSGDVIKASRSRDHKRKKPKPKPGAGKEDGEEGKAALSNLRVLLVDDNAINCRLAARLLQLNGADGVCF